MIRLARMDELPLIMEMVSAGIQQLAEQHSPQWQNGYGPSEEQFIQDIHAKNCFVYTQDEAILAVAVVVKGQEVAYQTLTDDKWLATSDVYDTIHRFVVRSGTKGVGKQFLTELVQQQVAQEHLDIRIDTHELNLGMQKVILYAGFTYIGKVHYSIPNGERLVYQYLAKKS